MAYQLVLPKKVQKDLQKIDSRYLKKIQAALVVLRQNPFIGKKLDGEFQQQRSYEVWPYRIIYELVKNELIIMVIKIDHRQGVYK